MNYSNSQRAGVILYLTASLFGGYELSVKTDMLEQQQKQLLNREQIRTKIYKNILYSAAIYLIYLAIFFVGHYFYFSLEWEVWGKPIIFAEFSVATAIVIVIWAKSFSNR